MIKIFTYTLFTILTIVFFSSIELIGLKIGLPWTLSKLIPYLLLLIFGVLLCGWFIKNLQIKNNFVKLSILIVMLLLPFGIGFYLHPIYDVDLKKESSAFQQPKNLTELNEIDLAIIAIPGCQFCHGAIEDLKILKERNPQMRIRFIVVSDDKEDAKQYQLKVGEAFEVITSPNADALYQLASGSFPTFVYLKNNKVQSVWGNDRFGVRSKDFLEKRTHK